MRGIAEDGKKDETKEENAKDKWEEEERKE
jgi:hypothetical protein